MKNKALCTGGGGARLKHFLHFFHYRYPIQFVSSEAENGALQVNSNNESHTIYSLIYWNTKTFQSHTCNRMEEVNLLLDNF